MNAYEIILNKREGRELTSEQLSYMVLGFLDGRVEDYQMSAFLMATFFSGMTDEETEALTRIMLESGDVLDERRDRAEGGQALHGRRGRQALSCRSADSGGGRRESADGVRQGTRPHGRHA